jgi:hypothetical protein
MLSRRIFTLGIMLCTGCLLSGTGVSTRAHAVAPGLKGGLKSAEVEELHKAKELLEKADHDYDGHRVKAIEDIEKAIHTLHPHHAGKGGKSEKHEPKKSEGGKEPQKKSDGQLREAMKILEEVEKQLHEKHAKGGGEHHHKAAEDVKHAIVQLHDALKVR